MRSSSLLLIGLLPLTKSSRLTFSDGGNYTISSNYNDINVFVLNSTSLTLSDAEYTIVAPPSTDDGESAIRVQNSYLYAKGGKVIGAAVIGGSGVTITTNKERDSKSYATFEAGVEIVGGSATRQSTTQGGNAVQIIQMGSEVCYALVKLLLLLCIESLSRRMYTMCMQATFYGGKFTPGTGCTLEVCGVLTEDGNALQVLYGKAIIKGGQFEGKIYSISGDIEVHGCVELNEERITGFLLDGNNIDVGYDGQVNDLSIVYNETVCLGSTAGEADGVPATPPNGVSSFWLNSMRSIAAACLLSFLLMKSW